MSIISLENCCRSEGFNVQNLAEKTELMHIKNCLVKLSLAIFTSFASLIRDDQLLCVTNC